MPPPPPLPIAPRRRTTQTPQTIFGPRFPLQTNPHLLSSRAPLPRQSRFSSHKSLIPRGHSARPMRSESPESRRPHPRALYVTYPYAVRPSVRAVAVAAPSVPSRRASRVFPALNHRPRRRPPPSPQPATLPPPPPPLPFHPRPRNPHTPRPRRGFLHAAVPPKQSCRRASLRPGHSATQRNATPCDWRTCSSHPEGI